MSANAQQTAYLTSEEKLMAFASYFESNAHAKDDNEKDDNAKYYTTDLADLYHSFLREHSIIHLPAGNEGDEKRYAYAISARFLLACMKSRSVDERNFCLSGEFRGVGYEFYHFDEMEKYINAVVELVGHTGYFAEGESLDEDGRNIIFENYLLNCELKQQEAKIESVRKALASAEAQRDAVKEKVKAYKARVREGAVIA